MGNKKTKRSWPKYFALLFLFLLISVICLIWPTWPSINKLCTDVDEFIPRGECLALDNRFSIIEHAFSKGTTSSEEIRRVFNEYLQDEFDTEYGHVEVYYLKVSPIDYLFNSFESFHFSFDDRGIYIAFSYES